MLRYLTAGESHGPCLLTILDGMPAGLDVKKGVIDHELKRRMQGYGRGKRMAIESDAVKILSGLRKGVTIGSPIALMIENVDASIDSLPAIFEPRPGHADLAGALKYDRADIRDILERASARETASRVAAGALAKLLLARFGVRITSCVTAIGTVEARAGRLGFNQVLTLAEKSPVRCCDPAAASRMCAEIDRAIRAGDSLGGVFEVIASGVPAGLGSHAQWDRRLDGRLAQAVMAIQAIKAVGMGGSFGIGSRPGSTVHDEIHYDKKKGFSRSTNNAGGIEGGMSNGEDIVIQAVMKPIATLTKPLSTVDIRTKRAVRASVQRSDTCAVPAAAVVAEAVTAIELSNAMLEKFGGDSIREITRNYEGYLGQIRKF